VRCRLGLMASFARIRRAALAILFSALPALAQSSIQPPPVPPVTPPPAGFSLGLTIGPGWSSNPLELDRPAKGDAYLGTELALRYRWALWQGGAFTLAGVGYSELYARESGGGINRLVGSGTLSQSWQGAIFTLAASIRTTKNQFITAHDTASQELMFGVSRGFTLAPHWTLTPSGGFGRRFYNDGQKHEIRARLGLSLARKLDKWTFRLASFVSYGLEDKTPILPRINDRTAGASLEAGYEWQKDREVSLKLAYSRTLSSYRPNRTRGFTLAPQVAATLRF
jgi:hypothetical protein